MRSVLRRLRSWLERVDRRQTDAVAGLPPEQRAYLDAEIWRG